MWSRDYKALIGRLAFGELVAARTPAIKNVIMPMYRGASVEDEDRYFIGDMNPTYVRDDEEFIFAMEMLQLEFVDGKFNFNVANEDDEDAADELFMSMMRKKVMLAMRQHRKEKKTQPVVALMCRETMNRVGDDHDRLASIGLADVAVMPSDAVAENDIMLY